MGAQVEDVVRKIMEEDLAEAKLKKEKMRVEREEEEKLRAQLLAKFAEDDRIEQMNAAKRRMKVQEHKREVEKLVEARKKMFEEERAREMGEYKKVSDLEVSA